MSTKIEWKPSELPVDTVIYFPKNLTYGGWWIKEEGGYWGRVRTWKDDTIPANEADLIFTAFEITSVPKSWYEEFRPLPDTPWEINREGHVRNRKEGKTPFVRHHVPKGDTISIWAPMSMSYEEMSQPLSDVVRKAFA